MIRHACAADIPAIIELCKEARDTSETLHAIDGCRETLTANLQAMVLSPHHLVLVKESGDTVAGVFIGCVSTSWWHQGFDAHEVLFYIKPAQRGDGLKMLDQFEDWAWGFPQTRQLIIATTYGDSRPLERALSRRFARVGATYSKVRGDRHG